MRSQHRRFYLISAAAAAGYGLCIRLVIQLLRIGHPAAAAFPMTVAFLFVVPLVIGFLTASSVATLGASRRVSWASCIFLPWLSIFIAVVSSFLFHLESMTCAVVVLPGAFVFSSLGGLLARLTIKETPISKARLAGIAVLPVIFFLVEHQFAEPTSIRSVDTEIRVQASPEIIWNNIERVPVISAAEMPASWLQRVGFPRPIEATLSHSGIGGVRHARFTGGAGFTETIYRSQQNRLLAFHIRANDGPFSPGTLDEHVRSGGRNFEVLDAEYSLQPASDGSTLLRLISHERLTTHFNSYVGQWTDLVMRDIQNCILAVVRKRAERQQRLCARVRYVPPFTFLGTGRSARPG